MLNDWNYLRGQTKFWKKVCVVISQNKNDEKTQETIEELTHYEITYFKYHTRIYYNGIQYYYINN